MYKITEFKQADHEDVNEYFGRCIKTMIEFKSKIDPNRYILPPAILTAAQAAIYDAVPNEIKMAVNTHVKTTVTEMALDNVSAILITAGLKSELRTEILKNNYITLREIKDAALKAERLRKEKPVKTNNAINEIDNQEEDVNAFNYNNRGNFRNNYRGNQNNRGRGGNQPATRGGGFNNQNNQNRGASNTLSRGGAYRGNRGTQNNNGRGGQANNKTPKKCSYCDKPGHLIEDCWKLQAKQARDAAKMNPVSDENEYHEENEEEETITSVFNAQVKQNSKN